MTEGNRMRGSVMSLMIQKKAKSTGSRLRCGTKRRSLEAAVEKLRAKVSEKRVETERMKKRLNHMKAKVKEMEVEQARMLEENKLAIEENVHIQLYVDHMLLAFIYGGA
ncbi:uncharacterized protein LOC120006126 [Tripterygium wilfordii]|uniref:uncharacterized protein LOC120006126 n=1 Tax=Tripterygium wilfordii TaxID=458696 RepID=UPI0018F7FF34|nr:uncharacterized protein LOC120006126 [Tripterygium wilfordii]